MNGRGTYPTLEMLMIAARPAARPRASRAQVIATAKRLYPNVNFDGRLTVVGVRD